MINRDTVLHIARLARLKLDDEEIENLTGQLSSILDYIEQLNSIDTSGVEPTSFMAPVHDPLRDDTVVPSLPHEELLQNAPCPKKGFFAVPKVIGAE